MRVRVRAGEPVRHFAVDRWHLFQRKLAHVVPVVPEAHLMKQTFVFANEPAGLVWRLLFVEGCQTKGRRERERAYAHIGQPAFTVQLDPQEHVCARRDEVPEALQPNAGADRRYTKAELLQNQQKQAVLLETVTATPLDDELLKQSIRLERYRSAEQDVQVLEGDRLRVR